MEKIKMPLFGLFLLVTMILAGAAPSMACLAAVPMAEEGLVNVAASANGGSISFSDGLSGVSADTLIDEEFVNRGTQWQDGTVWWQTDVSKYVEITFDQRYLVSEGIVQADDNDAYKVEYLNLLTGRWEVLWDVSNYDGYGSGMQTRPDPTDEDVRYVFDAAVVTNAVRVYAVSGDDSYSLSEVQIYGSAVPLPGALGLLASGLIGMAAIRRK